MKRQTIMYYTDQTYLHGGIERVLANKVNYFVRNTPHEVHLVTSEQRGNPPCYAMDSRVIRHDLGINYNRRASYLNPRNLVKVFRHYWRLRKKIVEINPDVVIICNYAFDFYFIPFIKRKILKVKEFHSSRYYSHRARLSNPSVFQKALYRFNDYVESKYDYLAVLTSDEEKYYPSGNTVVIPNALTQYPEETASLEPHKVISAGRVAPVKGFEKLIAAWAIVFKDFPEWELEIYGNGEKKYKKKLEGLIAGQGLTKTVRLAGPTSQMMDKMRESSVYAMSSITECFPMVLLESLSCGLPVVSFDCPHGPRNIIMDGEDGLLVKDGEVNALADGLMALIGNKALRKKMGENARRNILRLSPENVMPQWEEVFFGKSINKNT